MLKACLAASRTRLARYCSDQQVQGSNLQVDLNDDDDDIVMVIIGDRERRAKEQSGANPGECCHTDPTGVMSDLSD